MGQATARPKFRWSSVVVPTNAHVNNASTMTFGKSERSEQRSDSCFTQKPFRSSMMRGGVEKAGYMHSHTRPVGARGDNSDGAEKKRSNREFHPIGRLLSTAWA